MSSPELTPAQRAAAVDRIGESLALISGAGCGKTFVLARRFVELLLAAGEGADLSRFVALTFTEKAALEMSQRVRALLTERMAAASGAERERIRSWIEELPEARISTIHGFCASVLRGHAIDAGVDPAFAVCADDLLATRLRREAAEEALLSAVETGDSNALRLLARYRLDKLTEDISALLDQRTSFQPEAYRDRDAILARWEAMLRQHREEAWRRLSANEEARSQLQALSDFRCEKASDALLPMRDEVVSLATQLLEDPSSRTADAFARLDAISPGSSGSNKAWGGDGSATEVRRTIKALKAAIGEYAVYADSIGERDEEAAELLVAITALAEDAQRRYAETKRSRGLLDFTDLLERTGSLLAGSASVRRALSRQIDELLIDECQDTDAYQLELLTRLVRPLLEAEQDSPAGSLFIVGDAKQSIYRFRGAQVDVFQELCRQMGESRTESLSRSFRTHAAGVAFVNELFRPLMGEDYAPIEAHRQVCPSEPSVEILLAQGDLPSQGGADEAVQVQAAATAQRIEEMIRRGERRVWDEDARDWREVRPGDIAILFARMTSSLRYERELQYRGIPYYVVAGTGFFRRQEVLDVLNALRVVESPADDVAFMGVLRSSLVGLDDNALAHIAQACRSPYLPGLWAEGLERAAARLTAEQSAALSSALGLLKRLGARKDAVHVDRLIETLLDETGFEATLLAQFQGRRMAGNVRLLLERARTAAAEGVGLADFLTQMEDLVINEARYEQAVVAGEAADVVRIMTIHKAKGLEFPVVFIPDLNAGRQSHSGELLIRRDTGLTWCLKPDEDEEANQRGSEAGRPLSAVIARRLEDRDDAAEAIRKWYVAATRHRDHLIWVGADWRTKEGAFRGPGCFLQELDRVLGLAAAAEGEQCEIPYGDGRYSVALRQVRPGPPRHESGPRPLGEVLLDRARTPEDLVAAIAEAGREKQGALPLLGPLPLETARAEVAVTALGDFAECPMLYRWRYELRTPDPYPAKTSPGRAVALDAATMGTFYHRCMELLDFDGSQKPGALVAQVAAEMDLSDVVDTDSLSGELADMLGRLREQDLWQALGRAERIDRELDFLLQVGPAELRGQIDLLYLDADGAWHIIDYKSDRLGDHSPAEHAQRYELQMLTYALAAGRFRQRPPADATLYFLRTGQTHRFSLSASVLADAEQRLAELVERLIRSRRSGEFERRTERCSHCPYARVCLPAETAKT